MEQPRSQYHHYVPRFVLKPFSHPFRPSKKKDKDGPKKRFRKGQEMLYTINLAGDGEIIEAPLDKSFGLIDMYRDLRDAKNQHHLEQELSVLESQAGKIISRIRKRHEAAEKDVWMTRKEYDTLRKFLFIMKYRGMGFHRRFQHETADEYLEDDKERFLKYMAKKGFTRPMDVWFDNIKAILQLKMDPDAQWADELPNQMYPDDANWASAHIRAMYLALCSPSDKDEEFLLSENLFGIYEGPTSFSYNVHSRKPTPVAFTEHHVFAVISPKLMMVLRSEFLPNSGEEMTEEMKQRRVELYNTMMRTHHDLSTTRSVLEDLPVRKANNSYTKFVDESDSIKTLSFKSKTAALKTLEWYLSNSSLKGPHEPEDSKSICLKKLLNAAQSLGSKNPAVSERSRLSQARNEVLGSMDRALEKALNDSPESPSAAYLNLGGTAKTFLYDMDQARKMFNLKTMIDVWSEGVDENTRHQGRENLREIFCQLPPRRVYFYVQATRHMMLNRRPRDEASGSSKDTAKNILDGPEDAIAKAGPVFRSDRLSTILYYTAANATKMAKNPDISIHTKPTTDKRGERVLALMVAVVFGPAAQPGSICDCGKSPSHSRFPHPPFSGPQPSKTPSKLNHRKTTPSHPPNHPAIPSLESKARAHRSIVSSTPRYFTSPGRPWLSKEENIEMATRTFVKRDFMDVVEGKLPRREDLMALEEAMFGTLYPVLGREGEIR
ncbi:MAG: hypothetical protein Q9160_007256 [Pyrenula sp. 1 TL-2023]